jgi:hypothetical protein
MMANVKEERHSHRKFCEKGKGGKDIQNRHVRKEDADKQRANCSGYRGAVQVPCRRLLEDT